MSSKFDEMCEAMTKMVMIKTMQKMVDTLENQKKPTNSKLSAPSSHNHKQTTMSVDEFLRLSDDELSKMGFTPEPEQYYSYSGSYSDRADESKLRKLGYSVANNSELSEKQRQGLLQNAIEHGLVSKGYVITYLENNIRINGRKESNSVAVYKWKRDLEFVRQLSDFRYEKK